MTARRQVRTVRLRGTSADAIHRAASVLEDAMATATLPGADEGRWVGVRCLDLGAMGSLAHPLADRIRDEVRDLLARGCHGASPGAANAPLVWFADVVEAWALLLQRLLTQQRGDAWFWRLLAPWLDQRPRLAEAVERAFADVFETDAGAAGAAALLRELAQMGQLHALLEAVPPDAGGRIARRYLVAATSEASPSLEQDEGPTAPAPPLVQAVPLVLTGAEWAPLRRAVAGAARVPCAPPVWAVGLAVLAGQPHLAGDPTLPSLVAAAIRQLSSDPPGRTPSHSAPADLPSVLRQLRAPQTAPHHTTSPKADELPGSLAGHPISSGAVATSPPGQASPGLPPASPIETDPDARSEAASAKPLPSAPADRWRGEYRTEAGGLWFMIAVLQRTLAPLLEEGPVPEAFERHALVKLADSVEVPSDDASRRCLEPLTELPDAWRQRLQRATERCEEWLAAALPGLKDPLSSAVRRNGQLALSRTHLDVWFALDQADVELRRLGLDLDPGWVPWLGRIVSFHYGADGLDG